MAIAKKDQKATDAQASLLAFILAGRGAATGGWSVPDHPEDYVDPTTRVLVERMWIVSNGTPSQIPSGKAHTRHSISPAGEDALNWWLTKRHQARL